jgi:hypothetical protein
MLTNFLNKIKAKKAPSFDEIDGLQKTLGNLSTSLQELRSIRMRIDREKGEVSRGEKTEINPKIKTQAIAFLKNIEKTITDLLKV